MDCVKSSCVVIESSPTQVCKAHAYLAVARAFIAIIADTPSWGMRGCRVRSAPLSSDKARNRCLVYDETAQPPVRIKVLRLPLSGARYWSRIGIEHVGALFSGTLYSQGVIRSCVTKSCHFQTGPLGDAPFVLLGVAGPSKTTYLVLSVPTKSFLLCVGNIEIPNQHLRYGSHCPHNRRKMVYRLGEGYSQGVETPNQNL